MSWWHAALSHHNLFAIVCSELDLNLDPGREERTAKGRGKLARDAELYDLVPGPAEKHLPRNQPGTGSRIGTALPELEPE